MSEKEFNEIIALLRGLAGITEYNQTAIRAEKCVYVLEKNKQYITNSVLNIKCEIIKEHDRCPVFKQLRNGCLDCVYFDGKLRDKY
jgi:hypothetical protein